jgi:hypothetical protein
MSSGGALAVLQGTVNRGGIMTAQDYLPRSLPGIAHELNYLSALQDILKSDPEKLDSPEALDLPTIQELLDLNQKNMAVKVDSYAAIIDRAKTDEKHFRQKAEGFLIAARVVKRLADKLKERMKDTMAMLETSEVEGEDHRFTLSPCEKRLEIYDERAIPEDFKMVVYQPDEDRIRAALEGGEIIPGARLVGGTQLRKYRRASR